jgi:hypothetical protein
VIKQTHNFQKRGFVFRRGGQAAKPPEGRHCAFVRKKINLPIHRGGRDIKAIPLRLCAFARKENRILISKQGNGLFAFA